MTRVVVASLLGLLSVPVLAQTPDPQASTPLLTLEVTPIGNGYTATVCGRVEGQRPICVQVFNPEALTPVTPDPVWPPDPVIDPVPTPAPTSDQPAPSPDGTSGLVIVDADHHTWTMQAPDGVPLRDGVAMPGYGGASYRWQAGTVYLVTTAGTWYAWVTDAWVQRLPELP